MAEVSSQHDEDEPVLTWQRVAAAVAGLLAIALVGSYLVPGGGLPFGSTSDAADGWETLPWDACGSVRSLAELGGADLDDEELCAAWLEARSHSGGEDDFFVLTGEVDPVEVQRALGPVHQQDTGPGDAEADEVQLLLVRSPGNSFTEHPQGEGAERSDTLAIWYPADEPPGAVDSVLLSSESDPYPALERLISH